MVRSSRVADLSRLRFAERNLVGADLPWIADFYENSVLWQLGKIWEGNVNG